ncbi:hypothetical protein [Levilactobacillus tongjiangensis]|uniref:Secreted protein n=1 Tax=Levilactobacillus tongjiangensis TaxID=2486023 RepID=A0ABW1SS55_9LACO|nr:hypothetical protein [Levilactobacillus tongjiangensis]
MAQHHPRFTRRGFLTLWALLLLAGVSLLLTVVMVATTAQRQVTNVLVRRYDQATETVHWQNAQHVKKTTGKPVRNRAK